MDIHKSPFNDFADWLAKTERIKSFYLPRQRLDMRKWRSFLPHFWTLLSTSDGLPPLCALGLQASCPHLPTALLPETAVPEPSSSLTRHKCVFNVSLCTANIASMYNGDWGHAGKTAYLRQQFLAMKLLFLGLQETRTPETFSCADGVIRLGSGYADGRLYGVELWGQHYHPVWLGWKTPFVVPPFGFPSTPSGSQSTFSQSRNHALAPVPSGWLCPTIWSTR